MKQQFEEASYIKGFNEGYMMAEHFPDLAKSLSEIESNSSRLEGFKDGHKEFVLEKTREQRPAWLNPDRGNHPPPEIEKGRDLEKD